MTRIKLAIVCTHPIQYYAPQFQALAKSTEIALRVFFTWEQSVRGKHFDREFGIECEWDIPLLDGYEYEFVPNIARDPGVHHFRGIRTPELARKIECWRADALMVIGWNCDAHLRIMRHMKGRIPVFFRGDSTLLDPTTPLRSLARRLTLFAVYRHVDVAIAVGQNNTDYFCWCGLPRNRIEFAPHSIDNTRFGATTEFQHQIIDRWRQKLGIGKDDLVFVFAGKFIEKKSPQLLLDAFVGIKGSVHLVYFGSGELESTLRNRAANHLNVHILPFQNQSMMPAVYRFADLFVLPSGGPGETWGLALNEAMASSRAIVASDRVGAARDLIHQGVNGWVFEAQNTRSLQNILQQAADVGRERLRQMGKEGNRLIQAWSVEETAAGIVRAIARHTRNTTSQPA